jgi:hypothetical protein
MAAPEQRNIDWGSAEIKDAKLSVELTGPSSKAWKHRFDSALALLDTPHNRWGEVHLSRQEIQVAEVQPGTETELRHFLESVMLQVNSELPKPRGQNKTPRTRHTLMGQPR